MNAAHKNLVRFSLFLWLTTGMLMVLAATFAAYAYSEKQIDHANELRLRSFVLAQELRQSSDDLTRMARTFVATGIPLYKTHFQEILAIRDGKQPRPVDYTTSYWDLVLDDDKRPDPQHGQTVALLDLLRQAGFTEQEFGKLAEAKAKSDALTDIEYAAMALFESTNPPTEAHRTEATRRLHDATYHRAKADIMRVIAEFEHMMDQRSLEKVRAREDIAVGLRTVFTALGLVLIVVLWWTYRALKAVLGGPVAEIYVQIAALGGGRFDTPIPVPKGMDNSVLAWLAETQQKLARLHREHQAVMVRHQRLSRLHNALSECNQAIVRCTDEAELFFRVCQDVVTVGGMQMAWIGILDSQTQHIQPVAAWGAGTEYLDGIFISTSASEAAGRGPTGTAARENRAVWCQDFQHDQGTTPWHARSAIFGWQASAALPLHRADKVVGVLTIYSSELNAFEEPERNLLLEMAIDIDHALHSYEREAQRQAAVADLADSRNLLQSIVNTVPVRVFWKDRELRYLGCNPAFAKDAGAEEPQDLIGKDDYQVNPALAELYRADDRQVMASGQPKLSYEEPLRLPDGQEIWLRTSKVPLRDVNDAIIGVLGIYENITEQRRADTALRDSEARFRTLFNAAPIPMAICNQNTLTQVNERFSRIFGYTLEDIPTLDDWWPRAYPDPEYRRWVMETWTYLVQRSIANDDYITPDEYRVTCKNGEVRTVIGSGVTIGDDFLITIVDITERKNAELALHGAETQIRTVLNTMPAGVIVAEKATANIVFVNEFFCQMFGYSHRQLMAMNVVDLAPPQQRERVMASFAAAAGGRIGIKDSLPFVRCDGSILLVEIRDTDIEIAGRRCLLGIFTDITERLALESERERQREILEITVRERTAQLLATSRQLNDTILALERVGTSIFWAEVDTGRLLSVNQYAADILGYTQDELTELAVCDIDVNLDSQEKYWEVAKDIATKGFLRFDTTQKCKDGQLIPIEMSVYYRPSAAGEPARFVGFGVDISERKATEAALREAKATAETATQAKSSFLSIMSHEIRTPVAGILGLTRIMRRQAEQPEQIQNLDKIAAAGQHLLSIINDVLDISKIEAGKFTLEERPLQIESALANVVSILKARADEKQLALICEVQPFPQRFLGDPTRLQQAILNYVSNAIKFTHQGRITIRALVVEDAHDSAVWRFEVEDTGVGVEPDTLPRLFRAFEQADSSTTRNYGGTGLGLAINKKIAALMGGEVGANSVPGIGSTFWFTGRFKKDSSSQPAVERHASEVVEQTLKSRYAGSRILVVEDEPINREIATLMLEELGFTVDTAKDGNEAVALTTENTYQLILMDMLMPNKNGLDATRDIRKLPDRAGLPIIAMTANAFSEDRQACLEAGMDDFLSKPSSLEDVYAVLLKWLSRKSG